MSIVIDKTTIGSAAPGDGTTVAFTTNQIVASGGFIVVCVGWFTAGITVTGVAGGGLDWTVDKQGFAGAPASVGVAIASAQAPSGLASGTTITASTTGGTMSGPTIGGMSFTGVKTSSPVDGTPVGPVGVSPADPAWTSGNYTIADGSVIVGTCWEETNTGTSTPTAPSVESFDTNGGGWGFTAAYRIEASGGSYAVAGTWDISCQSNTIAVAYLAAPTGGPVDTTTRRYQIRRSRRTSW